MTRMEFLKQLEYLLQDIEDKDREDALTYYMDYMDDAGVFDADSVDGILDAPEKIAMTIRSSMDNGSDRIEFSEQGFSDGRLEEKRSMPDVYGNIHKKEEAQYDEWSSAPEENSWNEPRDTSASTDEDGENAGKAGKYILIGILVVLSIPLIAGIGGTALGILAAIAGILFACFIGAAGCGIGFTVGGIVLFVMSIVRMVTSVAEGLLMMGFSFFLIALGILGIMLMVLIFTRLIPWIIRGIVSLFQRIFRRGGRKA